METETRRQVRPARVGPAKVADAASPELPRAKSPAVGAAAASAADVARAAPATVGMSAPASAIVGVAASAAAEPELSARLEPFDSYWQAPQDAEKGFRSFTAYYRANYLPHLPADRDANILVVSCGPGYLVNMLRERGYRRVLGIDSDAAKVEVALRHGLPCETARAFPFLRARPGAYDVIIPEQELNHLTLDETIEFLELCRDALRPGGRVIVYAMNGANPLVGSENLSHNIDHFYNVTEYSLEQLLKLGGFTAIRVFPLRLYVFWKNPFNYVGLLATTVLEATFRVIYRLYGKKVRVLSKKIAAVASKP